MLRWMPLAKRTEVTPINVMGLSTCLKANIKAMAVVTVALNTHQGNSQHMVKPVTQPIKRGISSCIVDPGKGVRVKVVMANTGLTQPKDNPDIFTTKLLPEINLTIQNGSTMKRILYK